MKFLRQLIIIIWSLISLQLSASEQCNNDPRVKKIVRYLFEDDAICTYYQEFDLLDAFSRDERFLRLAEILSEFKDNHENANELTRLDSEINQHLENLPRKDLVNLARSSFICALAKSMNLSKIHPEYRNRPVVILDSIEEEK